MAGIRNSGKFTLWGLEVFLATAEEGAISTAAKRLGVSVSAVSQQLTSLEAALGVDVLDRSSRPIALTPAGRLFRARAEAILNEAEQARAELTRDTLAVLPRLRIGMIEDFDVSISPKLVLQLVDRGLGQRIMLETGPSHRLVDKLENRALDLVVASTMRTRPDWMEQHPVLIDPFIRVTPRDASTDTGFIAYTTQHLMGQQIEAYLSRTALVPESRFELDSYAAILAMISKAQGWSILTALGVGSAPQFHDLIEIAPLEPNSISRTISVMARQNALAETPVLVADIMRDLLAEQVVSPLGLRWPWLTPSLRLV